MALNIHSILYSRVGFSNGKHARRDRGYLRLSTARQKHNKVSPKPQTPLNDVPHLGLVNFIPKSGKPLLQSSFKPAPDLEIPADPQMEGMQKLEDPAYVRKLQRGLGFFKQESY